MCFFKISERKRSLKIFHEPVKVVLGPLQECKKKEYFGNPGSALSGSTYRYSCRTAVIFRIVKERQECDKSLRRGDKLYGFL